MDAITCEMLVSEFRAAYRQLNKIAKGPLRLLGALDRMAAEIESIPEDVFSSLGAILDFVGADPIDLDALLEGLESIRYCPYVVGSPLEPIIADTIQAIVSGNDYANLPGDFLAYHKDSLLREAWSSYHALLRDSPMGKLAKLRYQYKDLLKGLGITGIINNIAHLATCMEEVCQSVGELTDSLDDIRTRLRVAADGEVDGVFENSPTLSTLVKERISTDMGRIQQVRNQLANFSIPG